MDKSQTAILYATAEIRRALTGLSNNEKIIVIAATIAATAKCSPIRVKRIMPQIEGLALHACDERNRKPE